MNARTQGVRVAASLAVLLVGALFVLGARAAAQAPATDEAASASPAPVVQTDPETGERYVEVRPSEPLAQGRWPVEPWIVWTIGAMGTLGGAVFLARRIRRTSRGR